MPSNPLKQTFKTRLITKFLQQLQDGDGDSLFLGIGKTTGWNDESNPPQPLDTLEAETNFWREVIALKKISTRDIALVIPRHNWTAGTVYDAFRDDVDMSDLKFYTLVDSKRIYKCIDNNNGLPSNTKPFETFTNVFQTADGYQWKFMYQLSEIDDEFITDDYIPVFTVKDIVSTNDPRQNQLDVQNAAVDGSIQFIDILDAVTPFVYTIDGSIQVGSYIIDQGVPAELKYRISGPDVSSASGVYLQYSLKIIDLNSQNYGEIRKIAAYDGSTRILTLEENFSEPDDVIGYNFSIIPSIVISGDGSGARAEAKMNNNFIEYVDMTNSGLGYTFSTARSFGGSITPSGDVFDVVLSPPNGHGFDAIYELGSSSLMISTDFDKDESDQIKTNSDFRQFSLISNPSIMGNIIGSGGDFIHSYFVVSESPISNFGDLIQASSKLIFNGSGQTGEFYEFISTIGNPSSGILRVLNPTKRLSVGDTVVICNENYANGSVTGVSISRFLGSQEINEKLTYRQTTRLRVSTENNDFTETTFLEDTIVRGSVSNASGTISSWNLEFVDGVGFSNSVGYLDLVNVLVGFTAADQISVILPSGVQSFDLASVESINTPEIDYKSGNFLYLENIQVLERSQNQREEIKIVLTI